MIYDINIQDLPTGFRLRIALQIKEQLEAYEDILQAAKFSADLNEDFLNLFKIPLNIPLCVRKGTIGQCISAIII